jgi:hypothetical protein
MIRPEPPLGSRASWSGERWSLDHFFRYLESLAQAQLDLWEFPDPFRTQAERCSGGGGTGALLLLLHSSPEGVERLWRCYADLPFCPGGEEALEVFIRDRERKEREQLREHLRVIQRRYTAPRSRSRSRSPEGQREHGELQQERILTWREREQAQEQEQTTGKGILREARDSRRGWQGNLEERNLERGPGREVVVGWPIGTRVLVEVGLRRNTSSMLIEARVTESKVKYQCVRLRLKAKLDRCDWLVQREWYYESEVRKFNGKPGKSVE